MSVYQLESVFPSSVLPTISGIQYPSGYTLVPFPIESYENKQNAYADNCFWSNDIGKH